MTLASNHMEFLSEKFREPCEAFEWDKKKNLQVEKSKKWLILCSKRKKYVPCLISPCFTSISKTVWVVLYMLISIKSHMLMREAKRMHEFVMYSSLIFMTGA